MPKCRNCNGSGKADRTLPGFTRSWRDTCRKCDGAGYRIDWAGWAINSMAAPGIRELAPHERAYLEAAQANGKAWGAALWHRPGAPAGPGDTQPPQGGVATGAGGEGQRVHASFVSQREGGRS